MIARTAPALLALSLLSGCAGVGSVSENNFAEKYGEVFCRQAQKCSRGFFESEFSDMEDCIGEVEEAAEDAMDIADDAGCDFDEGEAEEFLKTLNTASCEEFYEGDAFDNGDQVFDCDGGEFLFGGVTGAGGGDGSSGEDPGDSEDGSSGSADGGDSPDDTGF